MKIRIYDGTARDFAQVVPTLIPGAVRLGLVKPGTWGLYYTGEQPGVDWLDVTPAARPKSEPRTWRHKFRADPARTRHLIAAHSTGGFQQVLALDLEFDVFGDAHGDPGETEREARLDNIRETLQAARDACQFIITNYDEAYGTNRDEIERRHQRLRYSYNGRRVRDGLDSSTIMGYVPSVSLYAISDDRDAWIERAKAKVEAAREMPGGRVFAWVWPRYHDGAFMPKAIRGQTLPAEFLKLQLEALHEWRADIVIWDRQPSDQSTGEEWYATVAKMSRALEAE